MKYLQIYEFYLNSVDYLKKKFSQYEGIKFIGDEYVEIDFQKLGEETEHKCFKQKFLDKIQNAFFNYIISFYDIEGNYRKGRFNFMIFIKSPIIKLQISLIDIENAEEWYIVSWNTNHPVRFQELKTYLIDMKKPIIFHIEETQTISDAEKFNL